MSDMTMVERVARAMEDAAEAWAVGRLDMAWECPTDLLARAAILAMRTPTESQLKAACAEADKHGYYHTRGYFDTEEAEYSWRAMIDAALSEQKP